MTELDSLLILNAVPGVGNSRVKKLIERFGSARNVLALKPEDFACEGITLKEVVEKIVRFPGDDFMKTEYDLIKKYNIRIITSEDEAYPELLKEIPDAPVLLYWKGAMKGVDPLTIAIVGSRQASIYGLTTTEKISYGLAELGITIVSGMAWGIDTAAHNGALKAGGFTIAVLGCGLSHTYAIRNKKLFNQIPESGAIVSEFAMQTQPQPYNFPRRNRIISGLSLGVIVVEAFKRSGALITGRLAGEQGREVFALPGNVNNPNAQGTNNLIQQGAKLISCIEDVLEELKPRFRDFLKKKQSLRHPDDSAPIPSGPENLSDEESRIYKMITNNPIHIDMLANQGSINLTHLSSIILGLELKRFIKQLPGKFYVKI